MQTTQGNMLLSLENAKRFTIENAAALGSVVAAGALSTLGASITEMSEHATVQYGQTRATKSAIARRRELRTALIRDYMTPIARIASLELGGTPELVALGFGKVTPTSSSS
ncbi:MAG: hypothetical protein JWM95_2347 [Gemmatimonadetes bacterium]|nr:hypothetical protein [Gemmatimonadota bacterium]